MGLTTPSLVFAASGIWETPLIQGCIDDWEGRRGQETLCVMGGSQIPAGLSTPVAIYPQLPLFPYTPRERARRCVDRSYDPEWQVNSLQYQHHSAQRQNVTERSYDLTLDMVSISDGENVKCSARVNLPEDVNNNGSAPWVRCVPQGGSNLPPNDTWVDVSLDTVYEVFGVRQAWGCSDGVAGVEP